MSPCEAPAENRLQFIDIMRAFLIAFVVLGHSGFAYLNYLYWFHMPAFFIISGYLYKQVDASQIKNYIKRKSNSFLIPYFSFGILISAAVFFLDKAGRLNFKGFLRNMFFLVYGGRSVLGILGVFWFVPCLLLTTVLFLLIDTYIKSNRVKVSIFIVMYLLAHVDAVIMLRFRDSLPFPLNMSFPWNCNVVLLALPYFAIGYLIKKKSIINKLSQKHLAVKCFALVLICSILITLHYNKLFNFDLNMKYIQYYNVALDLVIPLLFTLTLMLLSVGLEKISSFNFIKYIGKNTLIIMYLHAPINVLLSQHIKYNFIVYFIIGMSGSLIITYLFSLNNITKFLFMSQTGSKRNISA